MKKDDMIEKMKNSIDEKYRKDIGILIKEKRKKKKLTQIELAQRIGLKHLSVLKYEKGERDIPLTIFFKICKVLDIDYNNLQPFLDNKKNSFLYFLLDENIGNIPKTDFFLNLLNLFNLELIDNKDIVENELIGIKKENKIFFLDIKDFLKFNSFFLEILEKQLLTFIDTFYKNSEITLEKANFLAKYMGENIDFFLDKKNEIETSANEEDSE
jgi:DNA-binding helix-turn-helix protein